MTEKFQCLKCNHVFLAAPGPTSCQKCGHSYVKWLTWKPIPHKK